MKELKILNHNGTLVVDSRDVANMIGKDHRHLMRDINSYIQIMVKEPETLTETESPKLGSRKIDVSKFFIKSTYTTEGNFKEYLCYLLTKQGCDMVANKMTGEKGVLFTAAYVDKFYEMESALRQGSVSQAPLPDKAKEMRAEAMLYNAKTKQAELWMKLGDMLNTPEHKQLCAAYCSQVLTGGQMVLPLPQVERTYSAQEVADMYGITANRVGRIANENGLKTAKYGQLVMDVANHCQGKAVQSFRYNETGARAIGEYARKQ